MQLIVHVNKTFKCLQTCIEPNTFFILNREKTRKNFFSQKVMIKLTFQYLRRNIATLMIAYDVRPTNRLDICETCEAVIKILNVKDGELTWLVFTWTT